VEETRVEEELFEEEGWTEGDELLDFWVGHGESGILGKERGATRNSVRRIRGIGLSSSRMIK
jgi:hypothetical protein